MEYLPEKKRTQKTQILKKEAKIAQFRQELVDNNVVLAIVKCRFFIFYSFHVSPCFIEKQIWLPCVVKGSYQKTLRRTSWTTLETRDLLFGMRWKLWRTKTPSSHKTSLRWSLRSLACQSRLLKLNVATASLIATNPQTLRARMLSRPKLWLQS